MAEEVEAPRVVTPPPNEEAADEVVLGGSEILRGLVVLPPLQRTTTSTGSPALLLPPIRAEEPVQSIRAALAEVVGFAQITNYRLELESDGPTDKLPWKPELVSPFTGADAVVSVPASVKSLEEGADLSALKKILDDWGDLTPLFEQGLKDGSAFRIVLQRYDAASVKDHMMRLRSLLLGTVPSATSLVEEDVVKEVKEGEEKTSQEKEKQPKPLPDLPDFKLSDSKRLREFFYYASGEDPDLYHGKQEAPKAKKKKKTKQTNGGKEVTDEATEVSLEKDAREKIPRWNELEDLCRINAHIGYSGFHPPPPVRKMVGDIAYLEFVPPGGASTIQITAVRTGFYVNRSSSKPGTTPHFDPSPSSAACFSHSLLDCLLQASASFRDAWSKALEASKERAEVSLALSRAAPAQTLFRLAVRGDFAGFRDAASASTALQSLDASMSTPTWLVPCPNEELYKGSAASTWTRNQLHSYQPVRAEEDLMSTFGVDLRTGANRDWNEELQLAREMPTTSQAERIERARLLHKIMTEFGEAALLGVKAICDGHVAPMNPNESARTQVYLHNNIFFSRAIDPGPETFKLVRGDKAGRKSANRDLQCNSVFCRMDKSGISTLATVLIDYLGTRFLCQSVLPGILNGDKAHEMLLGAVESGVPLSCDEDMVKLLEEKVGETMMLASRPVFRHPLTKKRLEEIEKLKKDLPPLPEKPRDENCEEKEVVDQNATMMTCIPIEAKGILGADKRRYILDFGRLSPRDANWVPKEMGGTGMWEAVRKENGKTSTAIPSSLDDEEWATAVLRPELITRFIQHKMTMFVQERRKKEAEKKAAESDGDAGEKEKESNQEDGEKEAQLNKEHLKSLRLNVNVFLPDIRSFEGIDEEAHELIKKDEEHVREASLYLWNEVITKTTVVVKEGPAHQLPLDGKTLTEFLHRSGINCRYMGRLAMLAQELEAKDIKTEDDMKHGRLTVIERRTMPKCWLELLECEMVARAARHVLDNYLMENGGVAAGQAAQTIASFFSAVLSESEETAAQTETRLDKRGPNAPDEDDYGTLTVADTGGDGDAVAPPIRSRYEVWQDIELEIGRRYRYTLTLFNTGNKTGRARHLPLLRRLCQRTGVRLVAKNYDLGAKCLCSAGSSTGGRLVMSYPISPLDIVDIVPLMKHAAAYDEGFYPCSLSPAVNLPPLQVSLIDARHALERAHIQTSNRNLNAGLELAQDALSLFQRVTESPSHPGVIESFELMSTIFHEGGDFGNALAHGEKALSLAIQTNGFDCAAVFNAHTHMYQFASANRDLDRAVKHLRAMVFLLQVMGGENHPEIFSSFHKLATLYSHPEYKGRFLTSANTCFTEASKCDPADRLMDGIKRKGHAKILGDLGNYRDALEAEKFAFRVISLFLGKDHEWAKDIDEELKKYTKLAVEKGNRTIEDEILKQEAAKADAVAADLLAAEEEKNKPKKNKKKKNKK